MNESDFYDPVRKIGNNHTSLTGKIPDKNGEKLISFESSLERDFIKITNFNVNVDSFVEQPLTINYVDDEGFTRSYTPDFLVFYKNTNPNIPHQKPLLVEIKYRDNLKKDWKILKPKFIAAMRHCDEMDWKFKIITEVEIRTDYLFNTNFLRHYLSDDNIVLEDTALLLAAIKRMKISTPKELISKCTSSEHHKGYLLTSLWHLIAVKMIGIELDKKINMNSEIWSIS